MLTIVAQNNGETAHFEEPLPKVNFIRLLSCSLYNSWHTLEKEGSAALGKPDNTQGLSVDRLPPGHYTLESLAKEIDNLFKKYKYTKLETETNYPVGQLVIKNFGGKQITVDRDLAQLLGNGRNLKKCDIHKTAYTSNDIFYSLRSA